MSFVHLHNHSHYSLLDGLTKLDEMINYAKEQGSPAVAITDHGSMYGAIEFYQKAKKAGVKPIIGVETYLAPNSRFDKNTREDGRSFHLLLLAKNLTGYKNLIKIVSHAHIDGFYYKPRIDWEILEKHHEGLIASTACLAGEIPRLITADKLTEAKKRIKEYNDLFGQGNFYLELMDHPELADLEKVNAELIKFSKELNIPVIATNDVHYLKKDDAEAQDILLCLQNKKKITDLDRMKMIGSGDYSMRPNAEMIAAFKHIPEAVTNTLKIAEMCNLELELGKIQLPHFEVPAGYDGNSYLKEWCEKGISKRFPGASVEELVKVKERLEYELAVIAKMGWPSYFLIVADFINWAKDNKIVVGPGRGSAAGSLVCYLTGITNLDPLKYDLLFERFLNPERISMPDIDMDFADIRRGEVLNYVGEKYGQDHVAQIITFGTMAARAAVRDVGRVLDEPYEFCDKISKSIPMFMKLDEAIKTVPEVKELYNNDAAAKRILDYARRLEGVARHASTHACGVLITDNPLTEYVPIQYASSSDRSIISQYSLHPIEDLGLLKMDFLGLKNLTIIESALKIIKNTRGLNINIDEIPLDDKKTYKLFQDGETTGVFQFES
jgi:DNA polymerase-3 subunit alpha